MNDQGESGTARKAPSLGVQPVPRFSALMHEMKRRWLAGENVSAGIPWERFEEIADTLDAAREALKLAQRNVPSYFDETHVQIGYALAKLEGEK